MANIMEQLNTPSKSIGGSQYHITRSMLAKYLNEDHLNLIIYYPTRYANSETRKTIGFKLSTERNYYEFVLATTNSEGLVDYIKKLMIKCGLSSDDYYLAVKSSRFNNKELNTKYPQSVVFRFNVGYVTFNYRDILDKVKGSHFLSNPFNNGLIPVCPFRFKIPRQFVEARFNHYLELKNKGSSGYMITYDIKLMSEMNKIGMSIEIEMGGDSTNSAGSWIEKEVSLAIPAKYLSFAHKSNVDTRLTFINAPEKAIVKVMNCMPLSNSLGYRTMCGYRVDKLTQDSENPVKAMNNWASFVLARTSPYYLRGIHQYQELVSDLRQSNPTTASNMMVMILTLKKESLIQNG